jgi:hypothetical protein
MMVSCQINFPDAARSWYPLDRKLVGPLSQSGCFGGDNISSSARNGTPIPRSPACRLVHIRQELSQLRVKHMLIWFYKMDTFPVNFALYKNEEVGYLHIAFY